MSVSGRFQMQLLPEHKTGPHLLLNLLNKLTQKKQLHKTGPHLLLNKLTQKKQLLQSLLQSLS